MVKLSLSNNDDRSKLKSTQGFQNDMTSSMSIFCLVVESLATLNLLYKFGPTSPSPHQLMEHFFLTKSTLFMKTELAFTSCIDRASYDVFWDQLWSQNDVVGCFSILG
uniref:Uncharacterized protein n=1 Tax=Cacopsylla melanoneura TaxID=428564 RepID=A0A8D8VR54_9HEMI